MSSKKGGHAFDKKKAEESQKFFKKDDLRYRSMK